MTENREGHPQLDPLERRVLEAVEEQELVEALCRLVAVPSWGGRETAAQDVMGELMDSSGLAVDRWDIDLQALEEHPAFSSELHRDEAVGLVGTLAGEGGGRTLLLNGHVDVVPPGDEESWSDPPFEATVRDGRVYGRGALDMKGGLVAGLHALHALRKAEVRLQGDVHLQSVVGEEDGGLGTLATVLRGYRGDGAVIMEPTEMAVVPALAGCLNFRIRIRGLAAHGAVREEGVDAIEKLQTVLAAIRWVEAERNSRLGKSGLFASHALPFPISVGTVRAGDWASSVADHLTLEGRYGIAPGEDEEEARNELARAIGDAAQGDPWLRRHPPVLTWWGGRFFAADTDPDHAVVRTVLEAGTAVLGKRPPLAAVTYGADMGTLSQVGGTPAVLFGPGDIRRAHQPDEWVAVDELVAVARTLAVTAMRFCGVAS